MKELVFNRLFCFILIACIVTVVNSCQKGENGIGLNNNSSKYYVSFKANGVQIKYSSFTVAKLWYSDEHKVYNGAIQGYKNYNLSGKDQFGITLFSNSQFAVDTYQDPQKATNNGGAKLPQVLLTYLDNAGDDYHSAGLLVEENGDVLSLPGADDIIADAKVSITKITSTYIEGTFSGTTYLSTDDSYKTKVVISEGKFAMKRSQ